MMVHVIQKWMIELLDEKLDDYCLFLSYIGTNQLTRIIQHWMIVAEKIIQVWMITDGL